MIAALRLRCPNRGFRPAAAVLLGPVMLVAVAPWPRGSVQAHGRVLEQFGDGEAVGVSTSERSSRPRRACASARWPGVISLAALEEHDVALRQRQEVVGLHAHRRDRARPSRYTISDAFPTLSRQSDLRIGHRTVDHGKIAAVLAMPLGLEAQPLSVMGAGIDVVLAVAARIAAWHACGPSRPCPASRSRLRRWAVSAWRSCGSGCWATQPAAALPGVLAISAGTPSSRGSAASARRVGSSVRCQDAGHLDGTVLNERVGSRAEASQARISDPPTVRSGAIGRPALFVRRGADLRGQSSRGLARGLPSRGHVVARMPVRCIWATVVIDRFFGVRAVRSGSATRRLPCRLQLPGGAAAAPGSPWLRAAPFACYSRGRSSARRCIRCPAGLRPIFAPWRRWSRCWRTGRPISMRCLAPSIPGSGVMLAVSLQIRRHVAVFVDGRWWNGPARLACRCRRRRKSLSLQALVGRWRQGRMAMSERMAAGPARDCSCCDGDRLDGDRFLGAPVSMVASRSRRPGW